MDSTLRQRQRNRYLLHVLTICSANLSCVWHANSSPGLMWADLSVEQLQSRSGNPLIRAKLLPTMTFNHVAFFGEFRDRLLTLANVDGVRTPRMEFTPGRRIGRAGDFPFELLKLAPVIGIK